MQLIKGGGIIPATAIKEDGRRERRLARVSEEAAIIRIFGWEIWVCMGEMREKVIG